MNRKLLKYDTFIKKFESVVLTNTHVNNVHNDGRYIAIGDSIQGLPVPANGVLYVIHFSDSIVHHTYIGFEGTMWTRILMYGLWSAWRQITNS